MKRFMLLFLLASSVGAQTFNVQTVEWTGTSLVGQPLLACSSAADKVQWWLVKDCPAVDGWTMTRIVNEFGRQMDAVGHCGGWGPWIQDQHGKIMGQYRNHPCPVDH